MTRRQQIQWAFDDQDIRSCSDRELVIIARAINRK